MLGTRHESNLLPMTGTMVLPSLLDSQIEKSFAEPEERYHYNLKSNGLQHKQTYNTDKKDSIDNRNQNDNSRATILKENSNSTTDQDRQFKSSRRTNASFSVQRSINKPSLSNPSSSSWMNNITQKQSDYNITRNRLSSTNASQSNAIKRHTSSINSKSSKCHSVTCPRNPENLAVAHRHHITKRIDKAIDNNAIRCTQQNKTDHKEYKCSYSERGCNMNNGTCKLRYSRSSQPNHQSPGPVTPCTASDENFLNAQRKPPEIFRNPVKNFTNSSSNCNFKSRSRHSGLSSNLNEQSSKIHSFPNVSRSESTTRYSVPPAARPVRSKSNLGETVKKKQVSRQKESSDHIYDTINSCKCHRNAIDRIDQVLRSSKSVYNISTMNYDVPKKNCKNFNERYEQEENSREKCKNCNYMQNLNFGSSNSQSKRKGLSKSQVDLRSSSFDESDSDSTATYATIITQVMKETDSSNSSDGKKNITPIKLRTLDIKEEKRRTPDIVKCSRHPHIAELSSLKSQTNGETGIQRSNSKGQLSDFSSLSSDIDSGLYQELSRPSTVIYVPSRGKDSRSGYNCKNLTKYGSTPNILEATSVEEEIYSVVEEWPVQRVPQNRVCPRNHNANHEQDIKALYSKEYEKKTEGTFSSKYFPATSVPCSPSVAGISTLDPLRHSHTSRSTTTNSSFSQEDNSSAGSEPSTTAITNTPAPPNITFCTSVDQLCTLVNEDPKALVYVYKINPNEAKDGTPATQPSVIILSRDTEKHHDCSKPGQQGYSTFKVPSHTEKNDVLINQKEEKETGNFASSTKKPPKKENKPASLFQRLRRTPSSQIKRQNKKSSPLSLNLLKSKSKSTHNVNLGESDGVIFVEPNYSHENECTGYQETKLRFDYSNSWQHIGYLSHRNGTADL